VLDAVAYRATVSAFEISGHGEQPASMGYIEGESIPSLLQFAPLVDGASCFWPAPLA